MTPNTTPFVQVHKASKELHHNLARGDWMEDVKSKINDNNYPSLARLENWEEPTTTLVFHVINSLRATCKSYLVRQPIKKVACKIKINDHGELIGSFMHGGLYIWKTNFC